MSPEALDLVESFSEAAEIWGFERDQGHGHGQRMAEEEYNASKARLTAYIQQLETRLAYLEEICL